MEALRNRWDGLSARERAFLVAGAVVVFAALAWGLVADPLARQLPDARRDAARAALALEIAQRDAQAASTRSTAPARGPVEADLRQAFAQRKIDPADATIVAAGGRVTLTFASIGFDTMLGLLDTLAREHAIHVVEAKILPRVEPGRVRADLVLAR